MNRVEFKQAGSGRRRGALPDAVGAHRPHVDHDARAASKPNAARQVLQVTEAEVVYVGVDPDSPDRRPVPLLG